MSIGQSHMKAVLTTFLQHYLPRSLELFVCNVQLKHALSFTDADCLCMHALCMSELALHLWFAMMSAAIQIVWCAAFTTVKRLSSDCEVRCSDLCWFCLRPIINP